jgi:ABC-type glycerol-3-phosphate transport system permease component
MNGVRLTLLAAAAIAALLFAVDRRRPRLAGRYARLVVLAFFAAAFLAPFAWIICASFKDREVLLQYAFLPPLSTWAKTINLDSFRKLFEPRTSLSGTIVFWQYLLNSLFLASAATVIQLFFCSLGGYALAKFRFTGRRNLMLFMAGSMMLPSMLFLAPTYDMLVHIGWIDSYAALLVPGAANAFGIFLFRQAMLGVPDSLIEAARVDGAGEFHIYSRVVMPMVKPMTAAFCLIAFMTQWNTFLGPQIYLQSEYKLTVPVILSQYVSQFQEEYGMFLAGTFLSIVPIAVLFLTLQKEFISELTPGAQKR